MTILRRRRLYTGYQYYLAGVAAVLPHIASRFGIDTTAEQVAIDRLLRRLYRAYHKRGRYGPID